MAARRANLAPVVVLRPATMSIVRNGTTPLVTPQGGAPLAFDVIISRDEVAGDVTLQLLLDPSQLSVARTAAVG